MVESSEELEGKTIRRLYSMTECPDGLWTRLLSRLMMRIDQFRNSEWEFMPVLASSVRRTWGTVKRESKGRDSQKGFGK